SGDDGAGGAVRAIHTRGLCLCAIYVPRSRFRLHARAAAAHDHAGRADRRKLPQYVVAGATRHPLRHRSALFCVGLRYLPTAPDLQDRTERAGRRRTCGGRQSLADPDASVRAARQTDLRGLRAGIRQPSLEQLPVALNRVELGWDAAAHGWAAGVCIDRSGNRLVCNYGCDAAERRALAGGFSAVSAPVRAIVHARRHTLMVRHASETKTDERPQKYANAAALYVGEHAGERTALETDRQARKIDIDDRAPQRNGRLLREFLRALRVLHERGITQAVGHTKHFVQ